MSHKQPKTEGFTWLELSIASFNGSGYASVTDAEAFINSYIKYKLWKKQPEAAKLALDYYHAILPLAEHLITNSNGAGRTPSPKAMERFHRFMT